MKKLFSTRYNATAVNLGLLLLRVCFGVLMAKYGYQKLQHFDEYKTQFMNFMGLGPTVSLSLVIFAEFFCAILVVMGLFTRLACLVLVISTGVALISAHHWDVFGAGEKATLYLGAFLTLL